MGFVVIIPARLLSQRLPGKPLLDICGKSMIRRVYEQAAQSSAASVIVATDDDRIRQEVLDFGGDACLTDPGHPSGTDRLEEVCRLRDIPDDTVVVNVQGDEPLIPPAVIDQVAGLLADPDHQMATLSEPISTRDDFEDPNIVKLVRGDDGTALYFSRAPIPFPRDGGDLPATLRRHLGIYAYRALLLHDFVAWPQGELEAIEKLEQLRALARGVRIRVADACASVPPGVDTPADLNRTIAYLEQQ